MAVIVVGVSGIYLSVLCFGKWNPRAFPSGMNLWG